ncbi:hypothetical protein PR202_gb24675 [Eleusine coracana subsp. coracana]|uniref:Uncharacterized protein n=1 Tax=Eleusine coracana subsp. coracana TaxID=191504 RepID=A0AAV5FML9_ELECO|nr:hypothetical protein QOZ80_5BG0451140 [Eleusine coracana subsp. coracana]GJN35862.1 hypothetical protein PR202_gb24675 [Eleusine coracana subsp. coracana]
MDHNTCSSSSVVVPGADGINNSQESQSEQFGQQALHNVVLACSRAAALALVTYIFAAAAWRARREPWDMAFVFFAYTALTGLLLCLRRAEKLTPDSPAAERRRLQAAVWALSAALSCAFAYRISLLMPAALVAVVWCMTSFVVLFGFYLLVVLCKDHDSVDDVDCSDAGHGKPLIIKKIRPTDEIV